MVTGAAGTIGQALATRLLTRGARLCLIGRTRDSLERLALSASASRDRVHLWAVDIADDDQVRQFSKDIESQYGSVDILVHCAGSIALDSLRDANVEDFDRQYAVNVRAPYLLTQLLLPAIIAGRGQIVFVNSSAGLNARKGAAQYAATKHALRGLANSLREEVNEHGVRVLSVFPGRTAGRMQAAVFEREKRPYDPALLLQPDDVASIVVHALELPRTAEVTDINIRPFAKSY
jgi:NADP-dependent 3-hydroxy acid dehydrogenase YdfG